MIFHDIVPYTEKRLDCYQNMIVTILDNYGCDLCLLGSTLPWRYYRRQNTGDIANYYIASDNIVESLYGYKVVRQTFDSEKIKDTIIDTVKSFPVIVNVDQFYVPHHYVHIYQKQHGQHSLLINGYKEDGEIFYCVDAFPRYIGGISYDNLEVGIKSFPYEYVKMEYSTIAKANTRIINSGEIFNKFIESSKAYINYDDNDEFSNQVIISLIDNIALRPDVDFFAELQYLFRGTWVWELDRVADWTISYINTEYVRNIYGDKKIKYISNLILQCNLIIVSGYRLLFKSIVSKSKNVCFKGCEKLKEAILIQNDIYELINQY